MQIFPLYTGMQTYVQRILSAQPCQHHVARFLRRAAGCQDTERPALPQALHSLLPVLQTHNCTFRDEAMIYITLTLPHAKLLLAYLYYSVLHYKNFI